MKTLWQVLGLMMISGANLLAQPAITADPTNQSLLVGSRALLTAIVTGVGPLTFQWQLNGTNLPNNLISTIAGNGTSGLAGDGGPATSGKIGAAYGVAADGFGNIFIADYGNSRVRMVDSNGVITTVAGSINGFSGDGGPATSAKLFELYGTTVDGAGNFYIADTGNNRVRRVDASGIITTEAGGGAGSDGGPSTNASLIWPTAVACDTNGNLFIADSMNNRIRRVDTNGTITTIAGISGQGFAGDGGPATNALLDFPHAVAADSSGNVFFADAANNRIRKIDANGMITTIAGNGTTTYSGDGLQATNIGLYQPYGVAVDAYGDVFIADTENNKIRRVDPYGVITTVAGTNTHGGPLPFPNYNGDGMPATNAALSNPCGLVVDPYGRIVIADEANNRIRRFNQGPTLVLDKLAATNAGDYRLIISSSFGSITSSIATLTVLFPPVLANPLASQTAGLGSNTTFTVSATGTAPLAYQWQMSGTNLPNQAGLSLTLTNVEWSDAGGYSVIITNNYGSITSNVAMLTVGVPPAFGSQPGDQTALSGTNLVLGVAVTGDGMFSYQWQFNGAGLPPIITTVAGTTVNCFSGDGVPATNACLSYPQGVAIDAAGNMFIADNYRVHKVNTDGIISTIAGTGTSGNGGNNGPATNATLNGAMSLTFDTAGNLYISEHGNGDVRKVDTNGVITRVAGTGTLGVSNDGGQAVSTSFNTVTGVAFDTNGNMYICEGPHCRIRKVATNGIVSTLAGNTTGLTGGYSGDGGMATNAQLNGPNGIALDLAGNVFIADSGNYRVRKVDANGLITTVAGNGGYYNGDNQAATSSGTQPFSVVFNNSGSLFISDEFYRVRCVDSGGNITTVAGTGSSSSSRLGDGGAATNATVTYGQLTFDKWGNLFIADSFLGRIREVNLAGDPILVFSKLNLTNAGTYTVVVTSPYGSVTSTNFTLTVLSTPVFSSPQANMDGSVTLNISTTTNFSSRIYIATNLTPPVVWQPIYTNLAGGAWQFTDTNELGQPAVYYRLSTP